MASSSSSHAGLVAAGLRHTIYLDLLLVAHSRRGYSTIKFLGVPTMNDHILFSSSLLRDKAFQPSIEGVLQMTSLRVKATYLYRKEIR